jgi:hypothetical protein
MRINRGKQCTNKNANYSSFCGKHRVLSKRSPPKNSNIGGFHARGSPRQRLSHTKYLESKHVKEALAALKAAGITPKKSAKKSSKKSVKKSSKKSVKKSSKKSAKKSSKKSAKKSSKKSSTKKSKCLKNCTRKYGGRGSGSLFLSKCRESCNNGDYSGTVNTGRRK